MNSRDFVLKMTKSIIPEYRYNYEEDFSQWQKRAREKLAEISGLPFKKVLDDKFSVVEEYKKDGFLYIKFTFQSEDGYFVPCCLVKKANLNKKAPLCLCLQGHTSGMHISLGESKYDGDEDYIERGSDFAIRAAKEGMVAIAIEQRYMGQNGFEDCPYAACGAWIASHAANQAMATLLIGRTAIGERVWDIMSTIDVAQKHFKELLSEKDIMCVGNSGGGTATFYASCLDERITMSVPSCGVCTFEDSIMAINHCPCNFIPGIRKYFDMGDIGALIAPRNLVLVCGETDEVFPVDGVKKCFDEIKRAYIHIGKEDKCNLVIGNGGHRFYPDDAWPVVHGSWSK